MPRIQHKRGTSANLASVNPTPLAGELVWDSSENAIKIGDGATAWTSLAYVTATPRSHVHDGGEITTGTVAYARLPVGSTTSTVCAGDDARLSDARLPTAHKATHATGGSDALTPADIGAAPAASPTFTGTVTVPGLTSTGQILADDSTSRSEPVYSFDGDTDSGIAHPAADTIVISTAGVERFRVTAQGIVHVGNNVFANTATPDQQQQTNLLRLYNSSSIQYGFGVSSNALNIAANQSTGTIRLYTDAVERVRVDANGNVGIGTSSIDAGVTLDARGTIQAKAAGVKIQAVDSSVIVKTQASNATSEGIVGTESNHNLAIRANNVAALRVKTTGAVRFVPLSADPASGEAGDVYYNSSTNKLRVYNGTSWVDLH